MESDKSLDFLAGGGEMGALMRAHDWTGSALGQPSSWPQSLRTAVRLILNTGHPMYIFWGSEGACLYNDAYRPSIGPERHPGSLGRPALEVWAEIWDTIGPQIEQVMSGRGPTWHENQLLPITRNGVLEDVYWTYSYCPIDDEGAAGGIGGVLVVCTETTQQLLNAKHLAESEERLHRALSAGRGIGTWDWDVGNDILLADAHFAKLYGVDPARAIAGAPLEEYFAAIHPDDVARVTAAVDRALLGESNFSEEYRLVQPDGEVHWVLAEGRCALDEDGQPTRFPGVSFDITERKLAEERLQALNAELEVRVVERALGRGITWQVSPDLLGTLNSEGYFETSNPAWESVLGWSEQEVASMSIFEMLHPDDVERTRDGFQLTQVGEPAVRFPNRYRCKDGSYRWISWVGVPEDGLVYCSGRDITDEKAAEEELARAQEALRQSQKLEAIGQLTGGVAHDFNNLLTVIGGSAELLRRPGMPEERRERYIDAISSTVERASRLTSQLLSFARRQALKPETFDVGRNVLAVGEMVRSLTGSRIAIETASPAEPVYTMADPSQFDTALINLAVNARDAMGGEGKMKIEVVSVDGIPAAHAHPALSGAFVAISVQDDGCGIAADRLERIFEPFFTTKGVGEGTGLGLSQVFGFAKQSHGEVRVESVEGAGATFTLYLPRVAASAEAKNEPVLHPAIADGRGMCVLVVEDNRDVLAFATQTLNELGYDAIHANDGEAALAELAKGEDRFHVVFSDVVMPGMNGIDFGKEVRRLYPDLPVILTSGYSHVLAQDGTFGFELLHKPYSMEQLSQALAKSARWKSRTARRVADLEAQPV